MDTFINIRVHGHELMPSSSSEGNVSERLRKVDRQRLTNLLTVRDFNEPPELCKGDLA